MQLSSHFSLDEFTHSPTAIRIGDANDPPMELLPNLKRTAHGLEAVRELLGGLPIHVSSGYRSPLVNNMIGSKPTSQHLTGHAVDFTCPAFGTPEQVMRRIISSGIEYDQCILEFSAWVHISFTDKPRRQALVIDKHGTRSYS